MAGKIKEISQDQYKQEVLAKPLVVLDFYSTECPPCEALAAKFEPLSELYGDDIAFIKIFRQENRELAQELDVTGSPTLLFFKDGKITGDKLSGGIKRSEIVKNLDAMLPAETAEKIHGKIKEKTTEADVLILGGRTCRFNSRRLSGSGPA